MTAFARYVAERRKAIMGFFAPGVSTLVLALTTGDQRVSGHEWLLAGVACVVTSFGVGAIPNRKTAQD